MLRAILRLLMGSGLLALLAWAGQAAALPLPGAPGVGTAGESDLNSFIVGGASNLTIDWMVIADPGGYPGGPYPNGSVIYLFQLENTTGVAIDGFTITVPAGSVIAAGVLAGDDLDLANAFHPAHAAGTFGGLAGEEEGFPLAALTFTAGTPRVDPGDVTWTFFPMAAGRESDTLFFVSPNPPAYGNAVASDSIPPSPWGSLAAGSDSVPVPLVGQQQVVPEPGTLILLGSGLLGAGAWARRKRSRSEEGG